MTTYQKFISLEDEAKENLFRKSAVMMASRTENNYKFDLYQIFTFYIEIESHAPSKMQLRYRAFENTDKLEPYLRELRIVFNF